MGHSHKNRSGKLVEKFDLRRGDCKYRELIFKTEITVFSIFCQEKPFGELFSKLRLKLAREVLILRNPTKSTHCGFRAAAAINSAENLDIFTSLSEKDALVN